jgi:hypothetical protein
MFKSHAWQQYDKQFQPPATPGLKVTGEGAGEVEEAAVSTFVGSSELREVGKRRRDGVTP